MEAPKQVPQVRGYENPRKRRKKRKGSAPAEGGGEEEPATASAAAPTPAAPAAASKEEPATASTATPTATPAAAAAPLSPTAAASLRLQKQLASRPTPEDLAGRHVLTGSVNVDTGARIRAAQETIYRLLQRDTLARSLRNRAKLEDLRGSGILREGSLVHESGIRELLNNFLHNRPNAEALFRREVLKDVLMLWTQLDVPGAPGDAGSGGCGPPTPRHYHTLTMVGRRLVLLGGLEGGEALAPLAPLLLDPDSGHWHAPRAVSAAGPLAPHERYAHSATNYGRFLLLFGGFSGSVWLNDLWVFDVGGGQGVAPPPPLRPALPPCPCPQDYSLPRGSPCPPSRPGSATPCVPLTRSSCSGTCRPCAARRPRRALPTPPFAWRPAPPSSCSLAAAMAPRSTMTCTPCP